MLACHIGSVIDTAYIEITITWSILKGTHLTFEINDLLCIKNRQLKIFIPGVFKALNICFCYIVGISIHLRLVNLAFSVECHRKYLFSVIIISKFTLYKSVNGTSSKKHDYTADSYHRYDSDNKRYIQPVFISNFCKNKS